MMGLTRQVSGVIKEFAYKALFLDKRANNGGFKSVKYGVRKNPKKLSRYWSGTLADRQKQLYLNISRIHCAMLTIRKYVTFDNL